MILAIIVLAALLAFYWLFLFGRLAERLGVSMGHGPQRLRFWVVKSWLLFALPSLTVLALLQQLSAVGRLPVLLAQAGRVFGIVPGAARGDRMLLGAGVVGLLIGALLGAGVARWRRGKRQWMLGDIGALMPAHRGELGYGVAMAVTAGVAEELFFRLALPLAIAMVTGSGLAGFVLSALLFMLAHRYQGGLGMLASLGLAAVFSWAYLATASLWVAIVLHVFVDLNSLVLRPLAMGIPRAPVRH